MTLADRHSRPWWVAVGALALAGLALRIAAAQGGLWTDEAWSVIYAAEARDPAGVFLRINHDNNHHLYSLWLQAIGMNASPLLARLPAIVAGVLCVPAAALILGRRSALAGLAGAILFAISPMMVNFGSEARGYSMMILAALIFIGLAADAVDGRARAATPWWLALVAMLGMFSHLTMAAPVALTALWFYLERRAAAGPAVAMREATRVMGPALAAVVGVVAFVFAVAYASPTGMQLGGYLPFAWPDFIAALDDVSGWTVGLAFASAIVAPIGLACVGLWIALRPPHWLGSRARLYALLILAVPAGVAAVHSGNSGFARYYLSSSIGLLLLAAEWLGRGLAGKAFAVRASAVSLLAVAVSAGLWRDWQLIHAERGNPDRSLAVIAARSPAGARVALDPKRMEGVLRVAAAPRGYPLRIVTGCAAADYLLAAPVGRDSALPARLIHCGIPMTALASAMTSTLSGDAWVLYGRESLQTAGAPVSGPAPGASDRRLSGRAGVAQG